MQAISPAVAGQTGGGTVAPAADGAADEAAWVERARRRDTSAFEKLYRANADRVYGLCLRMTGNTAEAEDCAQEAFIQAWKKLAGFRGDAAFSTWIHKVAVNVVLGRMRSARREQDRIRAVSDLAPPVGMTADDAELRELEQAINELPSGARHVFVLHAVYGYSHGETGEMLGIAEGTSKAQLNRARRLLAQQLDTDGP